MEMTTSKNAFERGRAAGHACSPGREPALSRTWRLRDHERWEEGYALGAKERVAVARMCQFFGRFRTEAEVQEHTRAHARAKARAEALTRIKDRIRGMTAAVAAGEPIWLFGLAAEVDQAVVAGLISGDEANRFSRVAMSLRRLEQALEVEP